MVQDLKALISGRVVALILLVSVVFNGWMSLDPLGFSSVTERLAIGWSQLFFSAPFYNSKAEDQITVFLIDDSYMDNRPKDKPGHWPVPYAEQQQMLEDILRAKPKAIFIDLLYEDSHGKQDRPTWLVSLINASVQGFATGSPIPIIIPEMLASGLYDCQSEGPSGDIGLLPLHTEFAQSQAPRAYLGTRNCHDLYPLFLNNTTQYPAPAMALYQVYCDNNADCSPFTADQYSRPLQLQWRSRLSRSYEQMLKTWKDNNEISYLPCQKISTCPLNKIDYSAAKIGKVLGTIFSGDSVLSADQIWDIYEPCLAIDTFGAAFILPYNTQREANLQRLKTMVEGRIVLIGTHVGIKPDVVENPIHGKIPGVYQHAMALDNLITYGNHYPKPMNSELKYVIETLILFAILLVGWVVSHSSAKVRFPVVVVVYRIIAPAIYSVVAALLFGLCTDGIAYNWVGVLIITYLLEPPDVLELIKTIMNRYDLLRRSTHD